MKKITALIVEDDYKSQELLLHLVSKYCTELEVIGVAGTLEESIERINNLKPQLVLLDIHLNTELSFELFSKVDHAEFEVIFTTAYDQYALKAFKYQAVDYILKPIVIEELVAAVQKSIKRIHEKQAFENRNFNETSKASTHSSEHLSIFSLGKVDVIKKENIIFCKSDGRYTTFYLKNNEEYVSSKNLGEYEELLANDYFFRIHHSYIINLDCLIFIAKNKGYTCEMINNISLPIAQRRQESLRTFLKIKQKG